MYDPEDQNTPLSQQVASLEKELEQLKQKLSQQELDENIWNPEPNITERVHYYYITSGGNVDGSGTFNKNLWYKGNVFFTEEEAEAQAEKERAITKINRIAQALTKRDFPNWKLDWNNQGQKKHFPAFNHRNKDFVVEHNFLLQNQTTFVYAPEEVWKLIIERKPELLKIVFGITS